MATKKNATCVICGKHYSIMEGFYLRSLGADLVEQIEEQYKNVKPSSFICLSDLQHIRLSNLEKTINEDLESNRKINANLEKNLNSNHYVVKNTNNMKLTKGQKIADALAKYAGSWGFIIAFCIFLFLWMSINTLHIFGIHFDSYPFILLNLFLSCLAALQAPIIMMSQNRQAERDRFDAENDYKTNQKTEMELRNLHKKVDQLNEVQWPHLLDIQKTEIEVLTEIEYELQQMQIKQNELIKAKQHQTRHRSRQ
ncbi:MAG TPA: DUF1003 domain-containing protein [Candidatus Ligilactobacillus excrementigallinarum]|uniref:DUF1003 domain-containing protein n=1 Tax=Candidatus Ligilactobacillus excrementigallinarum TaxID=2838641 RepID=A0A9D1UWU6_9LACO|nr:DUF1003 domain-containing protein [Candidatus Ligilactobacillus excrementigallinarum]